MTLIKIAFGFTLMGFSVALSAWCSEVHLSPPRGHMSGTDMSQIFVTAIFLLFAPALAICGKTLINKSTASKVINIVTWLLVVPVCVALSIVLFGTARNVVNFL